MIKKDRLEMAKAFQLVSRRIRDCRGNLICFTLSDLRRESLISSNAFWNCKRYVEKQIGTNTTYEAWVKTYDIKIFSRMVKLSTIKHPEKDPFRLGRLQWLKSMIEILEK